MSTWIKERWERIDPQPDAPVFQLVDASHPLRFYIGRDITGEYMLLLIEPERPPLFRNMRAVEVASFPRSDGEWGLLLKLTEPALLSVFSLLCEDLIASSAAVTTRRKGSHLVASRLSAWRRMLEEGRVAQLGIREIRGLYGELYLLAQHLLPTIGLTEAVTSWVGPYGADQDFQFSKWAVEVKTIQPDAQVINIASESQLHSTVRSIHVAVLMLVEVTPGSRTSLNALIADLRKKVSDDEAASAAFEERLALTNYVTLDAYDLPEFSVVSESMYSVNEAFPKIIPSLVPNGILNVQYQIELELIREYEVSFAFQAVN